jgi:hypothetical protein
MRGKRSKRPANNNSNIHHSYVCFPPPPKSVTTPHPRTGTSTGTFCLPSLYSSACHDRICWRGFNGERGGVECRG